jgi:hypothetical protein
MGRTTRLVTLGMTAVLTLTVLLSRPAAATTFSSDTFRIDTDAARWDGKRVDLGDATPTTDGYSWTPQGAAHMTYWDDGAHVRGNLTGIASHWGGSACGSMTVTWHYGNESTDGTFTKLCNHSPVIEVDLSSSASKDLVRVEVTLFDNSYDDYCDMNGPYGPPDDCRVLTFYVGDAPDSTGRAAQLDADDVILRTDTGSTPFQGHIVYSVTASTGGAYSKETGSLRWSPSVGERARLYIHRTYGNHAPTDQTIEFGHSNPVVDVNTGSGLGVREITMYIVSVPDGQPPTRVTPVVTRKFGDFDA